MALSVLSVVSEIYPLIKTGGLADVAGALPPALAAHGVAMHSLVPGYPVVLRALEGAKEAARFDELWGGPARLMAGRAAGLDLFVIDAPHLYARPGDPYRGPDGADWPDNWSRFAALSRVAERIARGIVPGYLPDVVHAHDWQAGLAPAYLHYTPGRPVGSVLTIHNLAFQGQYPPWLLGRLGLPAAAWSIGGVEYYGGIGYLKAGVQLADRITTVSPSYAEEIQSAAGGMGMDGLLRQRSAVLSGILNGIDTAVWNPAADPLLPAPFERGKLAGRAASKAALQARLGLAADPGAMLIGVVSRLTWQKGMDLLLAALPSLLGQGAQLALLGSGDAGLQQGFVAAAAAHPGRIGVQVGYDEALAHLIQAGADVAAVPSRFEPCGLTQLCALRYGALPLVSRVGGLTDTVIDASEVAVAAGVATGVMFAPVTLEALEAAIKRTARLWRQQATWRTLQANAMATEVGWERSAGRYAALFRDLAGVEVEPVIAEPVIAGPVIKVKRRPNLVGAAGFEPTTPSPPD